MKKIITALLTILSLSSYSQWTSNTSQNTEVSGLRSGPLSSATTSDGRTWIAYYNEVGGAYQMRAQLLNADGTKALGPDGVLVSSEPSGSATFVYNACLNPSDNALIIAFQYQVAGILTAVVSKVETNGNLSWGAAGTLLTAGLAPYPSVLSTGEIVIAWNNSSPGTCYLQKLSTSGVPQWGAPVEVKVGTTNTTACQPVAISEGAFILVIQRKGIGVGSVLFAQRYTNAGTPVWGAPVQLSSYTTSTVRYYSALSVADTVYLGYYAASGSRFLSFLQRINPDGVLPYGINGAVFSTYSTGSDPYMTTTNIEKDPAGPYIWSVVAACNTAQSQFGVMVQKFDMSNGARLLDPLGKEVYPITAARDQSIGTISVVNGGPVFMHYEDVTYKIFATRLNDQGNFVWPGDKVELSSTNATLAVPKGRFAFTKMTNGQSVALWNENRGVEIRTYAQNITLGGSTGPLAIVPVTLTELRGNRYGKNIVLNWATMTENNNSGFEVEHSVDSRNFLRLSFVDSKSANGNSNSRLDYSVLDKSPFAGSNYYRIKQLDKDKRFVYSNILFIKPTPSGGTIIGDIYPNPVKNILNMPVESNSAGKLEYVITDIKGQTIIKNIAEVNKGFLQINIDVSKLASGNYFIQSGVGVNARLQKFIKGSF